MVETNVLNELRQFEYRQNALDEVKAKFNGMIYDITTRVTLPIEDYKELIDEILSRYYSNNGDDADVNTIKSSRVYYESDINTSKYRDQYAELLQALFRVNSGHIFMFSNNTSKLGLFLSNPKTIQSAIDFLKQDGNAIKIILIHPTQPGIHDDAFFRELKTHYLENKVQIITKKLNSSQESDFQYPIRYIIGNHAYKLTTTKETFFDFFNNSTEEKNFYYTLQTEWTKFEGKNTYQKYSLGDADYNNDYGVKTLNDVVNKLDNLNQMMAIFLAKQLNISLDISVNNNIEDLIKKVLK